MPTSPEVAANAPADAAAPRLVFLVFGSGLEKANPVMADSFAWGIEHPAVSNDKGGTGDIRIGTGEAREFSFTKRPDAASAHLLQASLAGNSVGDVTVMISHRPQDFNTVQSVAKEAYRFTRCFVSGFAVRHVDGVSVETVSLRFRELAYFFYPADSDRPEAADWDVSKNQRSRQK